MPEQTLLAMPIQHLVLTGVLVLCRIGACIALMPGLSSGHIPAQIRLLVALAFSFAVLPLVAANIEPAILDVHLVTIVILVMAETLIGLSIGLMSRVYFWALQFMANVIAMGIGFNGTPAEAITENDPQPALATIITFSGLALFFANDLHLDILRALYGSYSAFPVRPQILANAALIDLVDTVSHAFITSLRIAAPFIVYAVTINFSIGLINKLTPAIPVYFISMPFVVGGGLLLLYFLIPELLRIFINETGSYLKSLY